MLDKDTITDNKMPELTEDELRELEAESERQYQAFLKLLERNRRRDAENAREKQRESRTKMKKFIAKQGWK
jgi:CRP-like cAMP-binding protein